MSVLIDSEKSFEDFIDQPDVSVIIDFYADWCGPCRMQAPILEKIESEYPEKVMLAKVNVDETPSIAREFHVTSIPTVIIFRDSEQVDAFVGLRSEEEVKELLGLE